METVKYYKLIEYAWDCPECEALNEPDEDPGQAESITCDVCGKEFKPEEES